jgi:DNA-directed RNA polymerase I subunit RPA2
MVGDKYQVRATGKMNNITRQPLKGRKKGGGIRLGEMERDGLLAHGASFLLRDRFMWCSDGCNVQLCQTCGSFLFTEDRKNENGYEEIYCTFCRKSGGTCTVFIPYVLRYLAAEFVAMNIRLKFEAQKAE